MDEEAIRRVVDELFTATDLKAWDRARALFAAGPIAVDMSSLAGGGPITTTAAELVAGFAAGLHARKASHHMTTNYRVAVAGDSAEVWAHGYAWNKLDDRPDIWETWGTYRVSLRRTPVGWRIDGFTYISKHARGDDAIRTDTAV